MFNNYAIQYYSLDYKDFLKHIPNLNNYIKDNNNLNNELNKYKIENEQLKTKINKLTIENNNLNNELINANKIISMFKNSKDIIQENNNTIKQLNNLIVTKDNIIEDLQNQLKNNNKKDNLVNFDNILFIHFISLDQKINCGIKCLKTDTFAEVEEKLYQKYEEYRETNNNFITNGKVVLRFKKICENNIKDGDKIQLINVNAYE